MLITPIRVSDMSLVTENAAFPTNLTRKSQITCLIWISNNAILFESYFAFPPQIDTYLSEAPP